MNVRQLFPLSVTAAALLAGFFSLLKAAADEYMVAAQLIMLSMILDGFDGNLARVFRGTSKIGAELDTYVDMISFGLAPAFLAYQAVLRNFGAWGLLLAAGIVVSGAFRLSRFRAKDPYRGQRGYQGLPITVNGGWIALLIIVSEAGLLDSDALSLEHGPLATFAWSCSFAFVVLQVSNVRYPKPTKELVGMLFCAVPVLVLFLDVRLAVASAVAMLGFGAAYAFIGPVYRWGRRILALHDKEEDPVSFRHP